MNKYKQRLGGEAVATANAVALIDSHCHIDFEDFDEDRADILRACSDLGIEGLLMPGVRRSTWPSLQELAHSSCRPTLWYTLGLHPYFIAQHDIDNDLRALRGALQAGKGDERLLGIGEIGLDYMLGEDTWAVQNHLFSAQLELAGEFSLPLVLHVRKAHDQVLQHLRKHKFRCGGLVHAFSGSEQQAKLYIDLGFKLGFGGAFTWPRALKLRRLAKSLPLSSIVLETDAPDMRPAFLQASRNTPISVDGIAELLATLREDTKANVARQCSNNFFRVFAKSRVVL